MEDDTFRCDNCGEEMYFDQGTCDECEEEEQTAQDYETARELANQVMNYADNLIKDEDIYIKEMFWEQMKVKSEDF